MDCDEGVHFAAIDWAEKHGTIVKDLIEGQYPDADQVFKINIAKGTSEDFTEQTADAVKRYYADRNTPADEMLDYILGYDLSFEIAEQAQNERTETAHIKSEAM